MGKIIRYIIIVILAIILFAAISTVISINYSNDTDSQGDYSILDEFNRDIFGEEKIDKSKYKPCEKDAIFEYAKEGESCLTSTEQILTCKGGLVSLDNKGLESRILEVYGNKFKCK